MFNPRWYENSRPDGFSVLEVVSPDEDAPRLFIPLKRTELKGQAAGPLASFRLVQTYRYTTQQCDRVLEAVYRFPLPGDAAVTGVTVRFGDVVIRAALKERTQAETNYETARSEGRQAALLTRESPDVFTLQITGLRSDQDITVETSYVQLAQAEGAGWSLRVPLTTAPRYVRFDEQTSRHAQGQPLALLRDPGHRFALDVILRETGSASSPTHRLAVEREGQHLRVRLHEGEVIPDRDCVLTWQPAQAADRPTLQVMLHDEPATGHVYFLALVAPPATHDVGRGKPREAVLLVDHSGSMQGPKWQAADWAVERFLSELTPHDSFALELFHNQPFWWKEQPQPAQPELVREAVKYLKAHTDSGGTELGVALEQALSLPRTRGDVSRHVLVLTDAEVTDADRILRLADEEAKQPERRRISVLCIDSAPNSALALQLAERGGGLARFLTSQPDEEDVTTALDAVLADWSEPVLSGLRLEVDRPGVEAVGRDVATAGASSTIDLGDLPAGRCLWVAGRVCPGRPGQETRLTTGQASLNFRLIAGSGKEVARCPSTQAGEADFRPALKALFGARRVVMLEALLHANYPPEELREQLQRLGHDPDLVSAGKKARAYAANEREDATRALKGLLVREALEFGLCSAETAFVATRTEAGQPVEETVIVANALPSGWSERFIGFGGFTGAVSYCLAADPVPASAELLAAAGPPDLSVACRLMSVAVEREAVARPQSLPIFSGVPAFMGDEAVLHESSQSEQTTCTRLELSFPQGTPAQLDPGLCLLIYVDDPAMPRARVRLVDLVRQGGSRPLNLRRGAGQLLRVVLKDPAGVWQVGAPAIEVRLES